MTGIHFSARAAALNASTLAILDAGSISLRAVPIAVAVAHVPYRPARTGLANGNTNHRDDTGTLVLDPTSEEEERASSRHVFAWAFGVGIRTVSRDGEANGERGDTEVDAQAEDRGVAELVLVESEGEFTRHEVSQTV